MGFCLSKGCIMPFPYSTKTIKENSKVIIEFDLTKDIIFRGTNFDRYDIIKMFEKLKFAEIPHILFDTKTSEYNLKDAYASIENISFLDDIIKIYLKLLDTPRGNAYRLLTDDELCFFVSIMHDDGKSIEFTNMHPSYIFHFEGEIT